MQYGKPNERSQVDQNIKSVLLSKKDPIFEKGPIDENMGKIDTLLYFFTDLSGRMLKPIPLPKMRSALAKGGVVAYTRKVLFRFRT